jgi:hypothetical protein
MSSSLTIPHFLVSMAIQSSANSQVVGGLCFVRVVGPRLTRLELLQSSFGFSNFCC